MNTPFDKFIEDKKFVLTGITVHELKHRLAELEELGMSDYKVMMFPDEDSEEPASIAVMVFDGNSVIFSA